jgi:hypothetical protein
MPELYIHISNLQGKINGYLINKKIKFEKYTTIINDNNPNNTAYNISSLRCKFNKYLVDKMDELISNNTEVVYNMSSFQSKLDEYSISKIREFMSNNTKIIHGIPSLRDKFSEHLIDKTNKSEKYTGPLFLDLFRIFRPRQFEYQKLSG